jgi:gluconolactonase
VKLRRAFCALAVMTMMMQASSEPARIERLDPAMDRLIAPDAVLEKVATGYTWTEGPVWIKRGGYLLFADIPANSILQFAPGQGTTLFMRPSGWNEKTPFGGKEPGSNGMTVDSQGRLTVAGHANRNVWRLETMDPAGPKTILADRYEGKRFNSPNDLVYRSDGSLYFTDPPYGLASQLDTDPKKELKINGVYRLANGKLQLLISDITRPNGIAFSPDEKYLYVDSSDPAKKIWMKYEVMPNGTVGNGKLFADATSDPREGSPDGMKVDREGNVFTTAPGGVWIFSPAGKHIGTIDMPERTANLAWAGEDGRTLYITASTSLYRIQVKLGGLVP